jgi:release factor glutamine methyltransferase
MRTVLEVIQSTSDFFGKHGVESPRLNIEHLLAHVLGNKRLDLYLQFDRPLGEEHLTPLRDLVKRRAAGEPLQHLLGTAEFFGYVFKCDARALVPRPETEQLVELVLEKAKAAAAPWTRIADVGTGSGVIAITLALKLPQVSVVAIDRHEAALSLARENATRLECGTRIDFREGDLMGNVDGPFDAIIANLPYIPSGEIAGLSREVQRDPASALDGGQDGLDLVRQLCNQAASLLKPGGLLALEIGHDQGEAARELLSTPDWNTIQILPDYQGRQRFALALRG